MESTSSIAISGNLFASTTTKAFELKGEASSGILFGNNVLTDVESDHAKLQRAIVENNLIEAVQKPAPKAAEAKE